MGLDAAAWHANQGWRPVVGRARADAAPCLQASSKPAAKVEGKSDAESTTLKYGLEAGLFKVRGRCTHRGNTVCPS